MHINKRAMALKTCAVSTMGMETLMESYALS